MVYLRIHFMMFNRFTNELLETDVAIINLYYSQIKLAVIVKKIIKQSENTLVKKNRRVTWCPFLTKNLN